ncbi:MAG: polymer-forming cytoskeletal protein [Gemmatimonadota bacterium]|nr:polymer-forming cytoskeletal protein [Gemmatimonadota bacterium]
MRADPVLKIVLLVALLAAGVRPAVAQSPPSPLGPPAAPVGPAELHLLKGDRAIGVGEVVEGDVLVVGGNLHVLGEVRGDARVAGGNLHNAGRIGGDATVTGGTLTLDSGSVVRGNVRVAGGELRREGGEVRGQVRIADSYTAPRRAAERSQAARLRGSWFAPIVEGITGIVSTLALALVLAGMGAAIVFYSLRHLETVSETIRASTLRSAVVGVAATFLIVPGFVAMVVLLAVSIVGIPLLLVAIPLYPVLVLAAAILGLLAAAYTLGEMTAERNGAAFGRHRHAYAYLFAGLAAGVAPLLGAHLLTITGLGALSTLIKLAVALAVWVATSVGLGAVILSRVGTRHTFTRQPFPAPEQMDPFWDELAEEPRV